MNCPKCGGKAKVLDCARSPEETYRERKCKVCGYAFYTVEYEVENDENFHKTWAKYHRSWVGYRNKVKEKTNEN